MFQNILLATDGSEHSLRSTDHAIELAQKFAGTIKVIYVVDGQTSKSDVLHNADKFEVERSRREKIHTVEQSLHRSAVPYTVEVLHGEPGPTIVEYANEHDFDCVVIGSRGLNNLQTFILGSVSHKVAKRVNCPVLIIK
ncbi:universal stress protein [Virgibacillus phasianinus]|uniref:Universal stress protein n=1 Tax=Virgibacillus phasianinus TaxID=2017483 RepID=A0A220U7J6_9BACI|nr:universal stress protein [Virgibacillus phasianinus]ASK64254.1 universal stress protein [Virgibacillus phasianinus]